VHRLHEGEGYNKCIQHFCEGNLMEGLQNRQDDNIKMDLKEVGCEDVNCVELTGDRF